MSLLTQKKRGAGDRSRLADSESDEEDLFPKTQAKNSSKRMKSSLGKPASKDIEGLSRTGEFISVLTGSGLTFDESRDMESPHTLNCSSALFRKKVEKRLKTYAEVTANENLSTFMEELKKYLETDDSLLIKALAPVKFGPDVNYNQNPESLLRNLLNIDVIQSELSEWLLEKLTLVALDYEDKPGDLLMGNVPKLILNHLRWLNEIKNGEKLTEKILEILDATPEKLSIEIIGSLPEILPDAWHAEAAAKLQSKMKDLNLTPAILDTFANLTLKPQELMVLRQGVLKQIKDAANQELPIMVKFVVSCVTPQEAIQEIDILRDNLDLDQTNNLATQIASQRSLARRGGTQFRQTKEINKDFDVLVMDVIRVAMTSEPKVSEGWFQAIDKVQDGLKSHDLMILLLLHDLPNRKKKVESLVKNKIRSGELTEELVKNCFKKHSTFIKSESVFGSVLDLAQMLMGHVEPALSLFSSTLFIQSFVRLSRYCRSEVVLDLVSQIGTNVQNRNIGLKTLTSLAKNHTVPLSEHSFIVANILDHVDTMDLCQVRQIMNVLSTLAYNSANTDAKGLRDNLQMVIRKQITKSGKTLHYKQIGVIGAVTIVQNMCKTEALRNWTQNQDDDAGESSSSTRHPLVNQAIDLLEMVKAATKNITSVSGLFMDELACVFNTEETIDKHLLAWISEIMANDFQDFFLGDATEEDLNGRVIDALLPLHLKYKIDDQLIDEEEMEVTSICIKLGQMVFEGDAMAPQLLPHFRLLSKAIGKLEEIDAVLGCPLWLPNINEDFDQMSPQELNYSCDILFYCYNWFRELINTFSNSICDEDRRKVTIRLKNMVQLEKELKNILAHNSLSYIPPVVLHMENVSGWQPPVNNTSETKAKKGEGKAKGKKGTKRKAVQDITNRTMLDSQLNKTANGADGDSAAGPSNEIDLNHYAPFFREWDLSVFKILTYKTVEIDSEPSEEEEYKNPKLRPPEFLMLMKDLNSKLEHMLVSSKTKKSFGRPKMKAMGFSNLEQLEPKGVINFMIPLLDHIFSSIEKIRDHFKKEIEINDNILDSSGIYQDSTFSILVACLNESFVAIKAIFSWNGFSDANLLSLRKRGLAIVGNRIENKNLDKSDSLKELVVEALEYLEGYHYFILNIGCATSYLKLCEVISSMCPSSDGEYIIPKATKEFLSRKWLSSDGETREKGAKFNAALEFILTIHLKYATEPLSVVEKYMEDGLTEINASKQKEAESEVFLTLNKSTLAIHYRVFMNCLIMEVKKITSGSKKDNSAESQIEAWMSCSTLWKEMIDFVKKAAAPRPFLTSLLKNSRIFIDYFMKNGMQLIENKFQSNRNDCVTLMSSIQKSTRFLSNCCDHVKFKKDAALTNHVPLLKRSLETYLFRVKSMLARNNCASIFWMGNLKHRDIKGAEVSSQLENSQLEVDGDDDDLLPDEDEISDVEIDDSEERNEDANNVEEDSMEF